MKMPKIESIERYVCPICSYQDDCKEAVEECRSLHFVGNFEHLKTVTTWYLTEASEFEFESKEEAEEALALAKCELSQEDSWIETEAYWRWKEGVNAKRYRRLS